MPVTELSVKDRIDQFREFDGRLESADLADDKVFQLLMHEAQVLLEMSDSEIANSLSISRPTLNRWINGRTSPHFGVKKSAIRWIAEQVASRVRRLQTSTRYAFTDGSSSVNHGRSSLAAKTY